MLELKAAAGAESKPQDVKQAAQALNIAFVSAEVHLDGFLMAFVDTTRIAALM